MAKYPVTNSWFEEFIKTGGYKNIDLWTPGGRKWLGYTKAKHPRYWDDRKWRCPNLPVVGVSWYEAFAFTRWLTGAMNDGRQYHLPNEKEWQSAAAGVDGRTYPWGDEWDENICNCEFQFKKPTPVGTFRDGETPEGVADLSGNVWEWTCSAYHSKEIFNDFLFDEAIQRLIDEQNWEKIWALYEEEKRQIPVIRGGSWDDESDDCRCACRDGYRPFSSNINIGFRCARI